MDLICPCETQRILRCIVREPRSEFAIPEELQWLKDAILKADEYQRNVIQVNHPFCHVTVRHGEVVSQLDDEFHSDGFTMRTTNLPEQNYVWTNVFPTEYVLRKFEIPDDFDPLRHNLHQFFQDTIDERDPILTCKEKTFYIFDPYVIHRRPVKTRGMLRTFVRITFAPIEIADVNNTQNPLIPRQHTYCGLRDFRNKLLRYPHAGED